LTLLFIYIDIDNRIYNLWIEQTIDSLVKIKKYNYESKNLKHLNKIIKNSSFYIDKTFATLTFSKIHQNIQMDI